MQPSLKTGKGVASPFRVVRGLILIAAQKSFWLPSLGCRRRAHTLTDQHTAALLREGFPAQLAVPGGSGLPSAAFAQAHRPSWGRRGLPPLPGWASASLSKSPAVGFGVVEVQAESGMQIVGAPFIDTPGRGGGAIFLLCCVGGNEQSPPPPSPSRVWRHNRVRSVP